MNPLLAAAALTFAVNASPRSSQAREGADLYAVHCLQCHGAALRGTAAAPGLQDAGSAGIDFQLATGRMPLEVPGTEPDRGPPELGPHQIAAIVSFAAGHGIVVPRIPAVHSSHALARGRVIYEANCQACHGASADGATVGYGWIAPGLRAATPLQIAEAVRTGPAMMPRFDERTLSNADLDALIAYVGELDRAGHPGGLSFAGAGPVAEGLFAWIAGIGFSMLIMRYVGETASPRAAFVQTDDGERSGRS